MLTTTDVRSPVLGIDPRTVLIVRIHFVVLDVLDLGPDDAMQPDLFFLHTRLFLAYTHIAPTATSTYIRPGLVEKRAGNLTQT
jgi:hypothetical protein